MLSYHDEGCCSRALSNIEGTGSISRQSSIWEFFPRLGVQSSELGCVRREAYYQSSKKNTHTHTQYWEKFALFPDLAPWASSSQQVYRQWTWPHSLISTLLFDGSFLPNGYLFSGTCLYETNFSDPLPPGVTRERISGIFTANRAWCTNERAFSYVSMCTPVIALESQLAGS